MLKLTVHTRHTGDVQLEFEHSLRSLSKWEQETGKCFLSNSQKSPQEMQRYYQFMLTSPEQDPDLVIALNNEQRKQLTDYMNSTPGATGTPPRIEDGKKPKADEPFTAEIIFAQMVMLRIPWEAQDWHVNRLLTLIGWVAYKQTPEKERKDNRSVREKLTDWAQINAANRERFKSNG